MFSYNSESETDSMIVIGPNEEGFEVSMTTRQMRDIIVRGTINFLQEQIKQFNSSWFKPLFGMQANRICASRQAVKARVS